jgi:hypothetical protein
VLIVALGVGAATAVFSVSETLLLRPLPYPDGDRLVTLRSISPDPAFPYERAAPGTVLRQKRPGVGLGPRTAFQSQWRDELDCGLLAVGVALTWTSHVSECDNPCAQ